MSDLHECKCIDVSRGNLIAQYELGVLDDEDRDLFEEHLMDCEFCRNELAELSPVTHLLRKHQPAISATLRAEAEEMINDNPPVPVGLNVFERIGRFFGDIKESLSLPRVYAPALVVATVVVVFAVVLYHNAVQNPYTEYLTFEPLAYTEMTLRGEESVETEQVFNQGMKEYCSGHFSQAANILEDAVKQSPKTWKYWMYLGICQYLSRQPQQAIDALKKADELTKYAFKSEIRWYLFQSYILNQDISRADSIYALLKVENDKCAEKADSLWKRISKIEN